MWYLLSCRNPRRRFLNDEGFSLQLVRMRLTPLRSFLVVSVAATFTIIATWAQTGNPSTNSQLMQQLQHALALAQRGDRQGAMNIDRQLLERDPKFVPAIKLKGMLLEESGQAVEAGAAYEEGLKLAPNDPDLLLKTGIYKLASGDREQAIKLLQRCTRIFPQRWRRTVLPCAGLPPERPRQSCIARNAREPEGSAGQSRCVAKVR